MKHTLGILTLTVGLFMASCSNLLDVQPRQSIDSGVALTTREGINAAVTNVYTYQKDITLYGRDLIAIAEALGDESRIINRAGGRFINEGQNVINSHLLGWNIYYLGINNINLILDALPSSPFNEAERERIEGELKFLRALNYHNLARVFAYDPKVRISSLDRGGVPLVLKGVSTPEQIENHPRASVDEVYAQIYKDLTDAVAKAPTTGAPSRATRAAAMALFARVALYNEDFTNAIKYATDALNAGVGRFVGNTDYVAAWRSNSHPESVFEILFQTRQESLGVNNSLQSAYTTMESVAQVNSLGALRPTPLPTANGWGAVVPTTAFLGLHQTGDVRRQLYQLGLNRSGSIVEECTKFVGKSGVIYMDNVPVIRISELILIRAEALARSNGDQVQALADVNRIRTRAGLTALPATTTNAQLQTEIELQRRLELAFEGHRWFDLKRRGRDVVKSTGNVPYGDTRTLAPIPVREIQANNKLVQNAGY
ncbi:RagB/SusD family nutrient uptake outer membrane protein [Rudanella lutea]|uniref:RagB/SusD family nutrient uptake outer membrane protein n=1 Tax=Rudanella lutea TaxID=451374 RepID=UPI000368600C|nr:RagB/SusD family nutrient uptake outer membrane protein [Rudanella lutea]